MLPETVKCSLDGWFSSAISSVICCFSQQDYWAPWKANSFLIELHSRARSSWPETERGSRSGCINKFRCRCGPWPLVLSASSQMEVICWMVWLSLFWPRTPLLCSGAGADPPRCSQRGLISQSSLTPEWRPTALCLICHDSHGNSMCWWYVFFVCVFNMFGSAAGTSWFGEEDVVFVAENNMCS